MKTISKFAVLVAALASLSANAEDFKQTVSAGYAHSSVEYLGYELDDDTGGFNVKYRMEFNEEYGFIISHTKTDYNKSGTYSGVSIDASLDYMSFMVGPTFRANKYFSVYLMAGGAKGEAEASVSSIGSAKESDTSFSYGGGLQINVTDQFVIDGSYEYSEFNDVNVGTWVVGMGFSF
ncbi:outer membrane beta-barrel protein [Vibrio fluvialis]|nr:outer membrane beta-barrel protein [Vibrio fluvialis]EKO3461165.1 outer membrane beta-barrel protein [Vibrio fluvialis]